MEDKAFALLEKMYSEFITFKQDTKEGFKDINQKFEAIDQRFEELNQRLDGVDKTVVKIEQEHGKKLDPLLDGYKQNSEQLSRIEKEVSKHEEVILRRVK